MEFWEGKVAIVTGASGAIGGAVAKELVRKGMIVCALARRKDKVDVSTINVQFSNVNLVRKATF
jgi:NADP-dependent 3-hydroxy acid dehydrogenase YdfG